MELDVSLLVTHAARGMAGSTSKSTRPVTASRLGGVQIMVGPTMKMSLQILWRYGCEISALNSIHTASFAVNHSSYNIGHSSYIMSIKCA